MPVTGIIAEYNPYHNGHSYQLEALRRNHPDTRVIIAMSGSFTQRGTSVVLDKWTRARLAVQGGCDLVLELPAVFALRSAQDFARGGVRLFSRLGIVDSLAFGTELMEPDMLTNTAAIIDTEEVQQAIRHEMRQGTSYAAAICHVLSLFTGIEEAALRQPNTILAIEYLRALQAINTAWQKPGGANAPILQPIPIQRKSTAYHDDALHAEISSANALRLALNRKTPDWDAIARNVSPESVDALQRAKNAGLPQMERLFLPILARLHTIHLQSLRSIYGINEGLEHRILRAAQTAKSLDGLVDAISSKRYPKSRIQRTMLHLLLSLQKSQIQQMDHIGPAYARVLAFNRHGRELLRIMRRTSRIPVITKLSQYLTSQDCLSEPETLQPCQQQLVIDIRAAHLRNLTLPKMPAIGQDFITSPFYLAAGN